MRRVSIVLWMVFSPLLLEGENGAHGSTLLCLYEDPVVSAAALQLPGGAIALQLTPPAYPAVVDSVQIYILSEGDTFWPWPDSIHQPFQISVFDDGGGVPGNEVFADTVVGDDIPPSWVMAYPDVPISSGDFWVAFVNLTLWNEVEAVGVDSSYDFRMRHWLRDTSGVWYDSISWPNAGDMMICAYLTHPLGMEEDSPMTPIGQTFTLNPVQPNPSSGPIEIQFGLPRPSHVNLAIHDLSGRLIRILFEGKRRAGIYRVHWNGRDQSGEEVSSGIYFYRLEVGDFTATRKLILLR